MTTRTAREHWPSGVETHYTNDQLSDLPDGIPAVRRWRPDGTLEYEAHYIRGKPVKRLSSDQIDELVRLTAYR